MSITIGISKFTLDNWLKAEEFRAHSLLVKLFFTDDNKHERLKFCLTWLDPSIIESDTLTFLPMFDRIHIDEKWFNMTKVACTYYLLRDEEDPNRIAKNKKFITKVMFLCVVAHSRYNCNGIVSSSLTNSEFGLLFRKSQQRLARTRELGPYKQLLLWWWKIYIDLLWLKMYSHKLLTILFHRLLLRRYANKLVMIQWYSQVCGYEKNFVLLKKVSL